MLMKTEALSVRAHNVAAIHLVAHAMVLAGLLGMCSSSRADFAVSVGSQGLAIAFSINDVSQGWRFNVDVPIQITHLGLLDGDNDGFATEHPIGVWDAGGTLLALATVEKGTVNPLINRFRYASIETEGPVILSPGQDYTIGYFLPGDAIEDTFVIWNGTYSMNPIINQVGAAFHTFSSNLQMPMQPDSLGAQCFGPGFQFIVVPAPSALVLLTMIGLRSTRRRG